MLPDPSGLRRAFASFGVAPDDETCRRAHYASMRELDRLDRADWAAVDRVLAEVAGVEDHQLSCAVEAIAEVFLSLPWVPIRDAAEALLQLYAAGFALAVVSNSSGTLERQLAEHRICDPGGGPAAQVKIVVDSQIVGVEKPDPRIFQIALDALDLPADRCLYVGDTVHFDVKGALAAGLHPVHLDPYGLCPHHDHPHIAALSDLVKSLV